MPTESLTVQEAALQITRKNFSWSSPIGSPSPVLTYGFLSNTPPYKSYDTEMETFTPFNAAQIEATDLALLLFEDVANINFERNGVGSIGSAAYSNANKISYGNFNSGETGGLAYFYTQTSGGYVWTSGYTSFPIGGPGFALLLHETGHTLGLSHPGDYDVYKQSTITYAGNAEYIEDSKQYSVMSYFRPEETGADFTWSGVRYGPSTLMLHDIAALQRLYGANTSTRTGDTVYGFNSNADRPVYYLKSATDQFAVSIWDAGGIDTLDFSGYATNQRIDLREGEFSNVGRLVKNVSIAIGAVVENAKGGTGADYIIGNAANNVLTGGKGNDTLEGGAGTDTAVFSGTQSQYQITKIGGQYQVVGPDGTDLVTGIERLQFDNGSVVLGVVVDPAVAATFLNLGLMQVSAANLPATTLTALEQISSAYSSGQASASQMTQSVIDLVDGTTSVAILTYQFFTGKTPTQAGMQYLVNSPDNVNASDLNDTYYQTFSLENRYINFGVNLGKLGEGNAKFSADYGALSLFDATKKAYTEIFGLVPLDSKVAELVNGQVSVAGQMMTRADYFAYYGKDAIGTKAAMVGWLLGESIKADLGPYAAADERFLADLADGSAKFNINLLAEYGA
ncbi:serralysin C precursor [Variibacter gotjawalensis]|uniref:Serralysin C n=1 Tax=Variibacter gotjawalensis TaxID=1333996 RepID=A0A0S3PNS5_9BRAD|nr:M10 family metallopeptidase [Variibacter gotjawalensis]NIK47864.1 serralysin [Variibacter gotjawalensis]RZS49750.1 serralysin [Variibacter gotjawalensis]BAT57578.1 serralysin C precursor [Variibacter gotjawalensis]